MGHDNQFVEQPVPAFVHPTAAASTVTRKDGLVALQTPVEPMDSRQTLLNEQKLSTKRSRSPIAVASLFTADKIFALALFILLIILLSYVLFHGRSTDSKLNRLINNADLKSSDIRHLLEEINRRLESIERLLTDQSRKTNINLQLNGQDVRDFYANQTVLNEFLRRYKQQRL